SSRRLHTRWPRDWSSDVCSSDLVVSSPGEPRREMLLREVPLLALGRRPDEVEAGRDRLRVGRPDVREREVREVDLLALRAEREQIGRASCRERVEIARGGVRCWE